MRPPTPRLAAALAACLITSVAGIGCAAPPAEEAATTPSEMAVAESSRPNIIVVLADDLGYSDLGSYGGEIETPNLDRLAGDGLRFTQFYNTGRCVPTRASLLTGLYSHRAGLGAMTRDEGEPGYRGYLTENTVTIAEVLREAGYRTGMVGKWHVSNTVPREDEEEQLNWLAHQGDFGPFSPLEQYPTARGFEDFYGNIWGVVDYFDPFGLVQGTQPVTEVPEDYYYTDAISDTAVAYIDRYAASGAPFFLYVAHTAPHWPVQALPEDIAKYENTYDGGWHAIREARHRRMIELGLFEPGEAPLTPRQYGGRFWGEGPDVWAENPDSVWDARVMAVHAAMVDRMDQGLGRIIAKLEETGELDNTLILFLSDNGASPERPSFFGPGFDRAGSTRDGREVHFPVEKDVLPGPQTVHAGIGARWANVSNTPFRWWKARVHEGGIATPMIVHWPAGLAVPAGSLTEEPGHVIDIMATALDVSGVDYPRTFDGRAISPLDGQSLVSIFRDGRAPGERTLFWEHVGARAVREGDWKLVATAEGRPWELYNLDHDRTEMNDLATELPARVEALERLWQGWAVEAQVLPKPSRR